MSRDKEASRPVGIVAWLLPSLGSLVTLGALIDGLGPAANWMFARDGDVGRHIRVGNTILNSGHIPYTDLFSHTMAGAPFVPYEWLAEVAYAAANRAFGLAGVALLAALLFTASCTLVYWIAVRLGCRRPAAMGIGLLSLVLQNSHLLPRPHLFTTLLTGCAFALLLEYRRSGQLLSAWLIPPLMLLWANLHGGFLIGFMLLATFVADALWRWLAGSDPAARRQARTLSAVAAAALVATCVNPSGPALLAHTSGYLDSRYLIDFTLEYQSPNFHDSADQIFLAILLAGAALAMLRRARIEFLGGALFLTWTAAALYSARNVPIFALLALPWIGVWAEQTLDAVAGEATGRVRHMAEALVRWQERISDMDRRLFRPLALVLGVVFLSALALTPAGRSRYHFSKRAFPVHALEVALKNNVSGNIFNQFGWGGYILYAAEPTIAVFIDGQTDFYGEELTREYVTAMSAQPGWDKILDRYHIDWTLTRSDMALTQVLALRSDWSRLYRDSTATIYVRRR